MLNKRITDLFSELDPILKAVVIDVLEFEQEKIHFLRVPTLEPLHEIITQAAKQKLTEYEDDIKEDLGNEVRMD